MRAPRKSKSVEVEPKVKKNKILAKSKDPYATLNSVDDHSLIQKNLGKLVKVTETEYIPIENLNE